MQMRVSWTVEICEEEKRREKDEKEKEGGRSYEAPPFLLEAHN